MKNKFRYGGGVTLLFTILFCLFSCNNNSSSGDGDQKNDTPPVNTSLGDPPKSGQLLETQYSVDTNNSKGIYIAFDIPKDTWATRVYIEGLGTVAEEVQFLDGNKEKGCFFYPFVEAGKEYTIRFVFFRDEDVDDEGFVVNYINDDGTTGWFETKVTAGSNSTGEVRFTSKGKINVEKNGDFRFTEKPTFYNEDLLENKWDVAIGLVEGISWDHGAERKTKWHGEVQIQCTNLTDICNFFEMCPWIPIIDFVCIRPIMYYEYNGKKYRYQWDGFVKDVFYPPKGDSFTTIDINDLSQVSKIYGIWVFKTGWNYDSPFYDTVIPIKVGQTKTMIISADDQNLEFKIIEVITKLDDSEFTEEEENHFALNYDHDISKAMSKISDDRKTLTQEYWEKTTLSDYFPDKDYDGYTENYEFKLFEDKGLESELLVCFTAKENGNLLRDYRDPYYKKQ